MILNIHESEENYLETIFFLNKNQTNIRAIDIVRELEFSKPSVSVAMKNLRQKGYIVIENGGFIKLTPEGLKIAERVYERHILITDFLSEIGVDKKTASEDACRIEHVISEESFNALKELMKKINKF